MASADVRTRDDFSPRRLARGGPSVIVEIEPGVVRKAGRWVTRNEEVAMRAVKRHTTIPVPEVYISRYYSKSGQDYASLYMECMPGSKLDEMWPGFDDSTKERICRETWKLVARLRHIPRPPPISHLFLCGADGSPSSDSLVRPFRQGEPRAFESDAALRDHIRRTCLRYNYGKAIDVEALLPRSDSSYFTHGDINPWNIMVDQNGRITGLLDWSNAGWYPDYWEYANMMRSNHDADWGRWMDRFKPQK